MNIDVAPSKQELGRRAAEFGLERLKRALADRGEANIIVATGASQFEMLEHLVASAGGIRWDRVTAFHLDEYVGLSIEHPASFRQYLWERFQSKLPRPLRAMHYLDGEIDAAAEARRVGAVLQQHPIDVAFVGIGENGHLAFNDPPADFETESPYLVVELDEACRTQQMGEGWFPTLADVPSHAISMGVRQIMKSRSIAVSVPDERKAAAVAACVEGPVSPDAPASILQQHDDCSLFLDPNSASKLSSASVTA